jgi:hypothetical protein
MKKFIWILIVLVVVGYFVNSYLNKEAHNEAIKIKREQANQATISSIKKMVSRTGAIGEWEKQLSNGESFRFEPLLTIELEKVWLIKEPILFIGNIKDIATYNETLYKIILERNIYLGSYDYEFSTGLNLSLTARKNMIDEFLRKYPNLLSLYDNNVAVIARISSIRSIYIPYEEMDINGERNIKVGDGELIDILYIGDLNFRSNLDHY